MKTLLAFSKNIHSQNGEDGILEEIFKRLGVGKGWFVEFGAADGIRLSNSFALVEKGWQGVDIEGEHSAYLELEETAKKYPKQIYPLEAFVSPTGGKNSLDNLLRPTPLPKDFDLLSVDIDSYDWWIWKSLSHYTPKVVIIEINSTFAPGIEYVQPTEEGELGDAGKGTSFTSMVKLGEEKGYKLVCHTGNLIFVRNDLVSKLDLPKEELENPGSLFLDYATPKSFWFRLKKKLRF